MSTKAILTLAVMPLLGACATSASVRSMPLGQGSEARYPRSVDEVSAALPRALDAVGVDVVLDEPLEPEGRVIVTEAGRTLFGNGGFSRVVMQPAEGTGETSVRVLSRSKSLLDASDHGMRSARLLVALDRALGPDAVQPHADMQARGRSVAGRTLQGHTVPRADGTWALATENGEGEVPLTSVSELAAFRGSYGQETAGGLLGMVGGYLVARGTAGGECSSASGWCLDRLATGFAAVVVGGVLGAVIGSKVRTGVWSPMGAR